MTISKRNSRFWSVTMDSGFPTVVNAIRMGDTARNHGTRTSLIRELGDSDWTSSGCVVQVPVAETSVEFPSVTAVSE